MAGRKGQPYLYLNRGQLEIERRENDVPTECIRGEPETDGWLLATEASSVSDFFTRTAPFAEQCDTYQECGIELAFAWRVDDEMFER
jgi:hypothetical protein